MRRLELGAIRICKRCGHGRAELLTDDGESLSVRVGPNRARVLAALESGSTEDVPWLGDVVAGGAQTTRLCVSDVVLDDGPVGLRGLVTWTGDDGVTVAACEPDEALETAMRMGVPIFATDEALGAASATEPPGHTLH